MKRLVQAAVVTAAVSLSPAAPASAQMFLRFGPPPPPIPAGLARNLRRVGIVLPLGRVRRIVHARRSGTERPIDLHASPVKTAPKPEQAARSTVRKPALASAEPSPPGLRKTPDTPNDQTPPQAAPLQTASTWNDPPTAPAAHSGKAPVAPTAISPDHQAALESLGE